MSRSSSARRWIPTLVVVGLVSAGTAARLAPAAAEDTAPVLSIVAPVLSISAPVLDIQFGESDVRNEARVERLPRKTTITLDSTVLFGKDSARINRRAGARLQEVAGQLRDRGPGSVEVTGYTDDLGSAAYGKKLSRERADAVAEVLRRDLSAGDFAFTVMGLGEDDPAVPNEDEASRRINRRVVVVYEQR